MVRYASFKFTLIASAMFAIGGCASTSEPKVYESGEAFFKQDNLYDTASKLSGAKNVARSKDGNIVCKRQTIIGSNFKRKICATADEWDEISTNSREVTEEMRRRR